jgi:hypothetical protein
MSCCRLAVLLALAAASLATSACAGETQVPGDEVIGRFGFTAELVDRGGCQLQEVPEDGRFSFEGIFSREPDGPGAWFTVNGVNREGTWDGQRFDSTHAVPRRFEAGACDNRFQVTERLWVAVLSQSQDVALGGECPADAAALLADGGVPVEADAGITPPGPQETGYDAARACGLLTDQVAPERECEAFAPCTLTWRVSGGRRL